MKSLDYKWCEIVTKRILDREKKEFEEQFEYISNWEIFKLIFKSVFVGLILFIVLYEIRIL